MDESFGFIAIDALHTSAPCQSQEAQAQLEGMTQANIPAPVLLHLAARGLFQIHIRVGVVRHVEVRTHANFVPRAAQILIDAFAYIAV